MVTVHNFANGLLNPVLAYAVSCLGAFLGLRCLTRARAYAGFARARWLILAALSIGATGIWTMHFIAMLGFAIPGLQITYNVPLTIASMLIAIAVTGVGLFIVGFGNGGLLPLLTGGVIIGLGVAAMHYMGMAAMNMPYSMHYNVPLFILSVVIAIVAGSVALWLGTWVRGTRATVGASLVMGVAVTGMHYTGIAALHVTEGSMSTMSGSGSQAFLVPLLAGITIVTFALTLVISLSPTEEEIHEDARLQDRIAAGLAAREPAAQPPRPLQPDPRPQFPEAYGPPAPPPPPAAPLPTRRPSAGALAGRRNRTPPGRLRRPPSPGPGPAWPGLA